MAPALQVVDRRRLVTWYDFYRTFLALLFVCFLTGAITSALKVSIARPRPNFFFQCWPDGVAVWENQNQFGVSVSAGTTLTLVQWPKNTLVMVCNTCKQYI